MTTPGWDAGRVYYTNVVPGTEDDEYNAQPDGNPSPAAIERRFLEFLRTFRIDNNFVYRDQLRQNLIMKLYFLEVDLAHLISFDEALANKVKDHPAEYLPWFENAVKVCARQSTFQTDDEDLPECQVMLLSNANPIPLRDLDSTYISKLIRIPGIIIAASSLGAKATHIHVMCKSCRHTKVLPVKGGFAGIELPRKCDGLDDETGTKDCPLDPYEIIHDKSKFVDQQSLKLQELHPMVPVGELPRHMLLSADRYLTNKVVPGTRVTVTGIYSIFSHQGKKRRGDGGAPAIKSAYIRVVGMQVDVDGASRNSGVGRTFTEEEEETFIKMSQRPNLYEEFSKSIAPSIYGSADIKKAVACLLFGGSTKILPDGMRLRGDINVLLLGDPGTAKSQLLKFAEQVAPIGVYTSGKGSSAAGLTASVVRDSGTREFYLEGGAMVLADGGVVCIDEFDKMREEDRVAIHEAMEQQTISIAKAGITTILNSRTAVLAAANPVFGRYDDMKAPGENIDFQSTILSRFDLIFIVKDEHNIERDMTIAKHVMNVHINRNVMDIDVGAGDIDVNTMRSYISYCKAKCAPRLSAEAAEKLCSHFVEMRSRVRQMEEKTAVPITVRQLEAVIRISEAIAKMTLSPVANETHVDEAIRLFNISTLHAIESGPAEGLNRPEFARQVEKIESLVRQRLPMGSQTSLRTLQNSLSKQGFEDHVVARAIDMMVRKDCLQYRNKHTMVLRTGI